MSEIRWRVVRRAWPDAGGGRGLAVVVARSRLKRPDFTREREQRVQRGCKENVIVKALRRLEAESFKD